MHFYILLWHSIALGKSQSLGTSWLIAILSHESMIFYFSHLKGPGISHAQLSWAHLTDFQLDLNLDSDSFLIKSLILSW